jgi:hypothetical protein
MDALKRTIEYRSGPFTISCMYSVPKIKGGIEHKKRSHLSSTKYPESEIVPVRVCVREGERVLLLQHR